MIRKYPFLCFLGLLFALPYRGTAQICDNCRFISSQFDSVKVSTEQFGQGVNADGDNQQLFMDIYEPFGDTMSNRPLVVFAFGGGFIQGSRDQDYVVRSCKRFAKAGYVAASIDYRIGFSIPGLFPNPSEELMRVFFRAMQDMRAAVQWFRAHADLSGNTYKIDPNQIYVGGASAGAITAIMMTYCDDSTEFEELGSLSAIAQLGGFYSSSGTYQGYSWEPQGVFNIAGAIVNTDWMEPGDPPIFSAHGDQDGTVPYQGGNIDFGFVSIGLEGSYNIDQEAESKGICSYLYTIAGGDHPSGNASDAYLDEIYVRALPRLHALINGKSYCCPLEIEIAADTMFHSYLADPFIISHQVNGDSGNAQTFFCSSTCVPGNMELHHDFVHFLGSINYYAIGIVSEGQCQSADHILVLPPGVGINDSQNALPDFSIAPNPVQDLLTIRTGESIQGPASLTLRDLNGAVIWEGSHTRRETLIRTSGFARGVYLLEVRYKDLRGVRKVILE